MSACVEVADDGIWIGEEHPVQCIGGPNCLEKGCFWRRFHELPKDKYALKRCGEAISYEGLEHRCHLRRGHAGPHDSVAGFVWSDQGVPGEAGNVWADQACAD